MNKLKIMFQIQVIKLNTERIFNLTVNCLNFYKLNEFNHQDFYEFI